MSVRIVPARSGKGFEYDVRFTWPEGGRIRERGKCPTTGKDASRRWAEAREAVIRRAGKAAYKPLASGTAPADQSVTFAEFWPRFLQEHYRGNRKKASTIQSAEDIYRRHLKPSLDTKPLHLISTADVSYLKGTLTDKSPKTVNNVLAVLSRALRSAWEWGLIPAMPRIALLKRRTPEMSWYELHDYRRLVDGASKVGTDALCLVLLAGSAGLRRGEIIALKWTDLDMGRGVIRVQRAFWRSFEDVPKGGRGRQVPMTPELLSALKAQRLSTGLGERVFAPAGRLLSKQTAQLWIRRAQRQAGLDQTGAIHMLRHTFCSHLAIAGVPAKAIQELAGHADLSMTQRYMHLSPANRSEAMSALARLYSSDTDAAPLSGRIAVNGRSN